MTPMRSDLAAARRRGAKARQSGLVEDIVLRAAVWAMIGAIFGLLFVMFAEALAGQVSSPFDVALATVGAAALTSLFYGSMRLTVLVANLTFIAMLLYTWLASALLSLEPLVVIGAGVGLVAGAIYGLNDKASRVYCAEAKIIAGAVAGLVVGAIALVAVRVFGGLSHAMIAMTVAPIGILAYILLAGWFVPRCNRLLPPVLDGMVVGLGVGAATGLMFLVMAGALDPGLLSAGPMQAFATRVEAGWADTVLSCAATCAPIGVARAVIKAPWYNM